MHSLTPQKPSLRWLFVPWALVVLAWVTSGALLHADTQNRGTFGDMFGAVNALFSGLAFATLIYTAWMQRDELALQREELAATRLELQGQKQQLVEQSATFALQRFEESFFALLRTHGEIVAAMDLVSESGSVTRSRDCFRVWYKRLRSAYAAKAVLIDGRELENVQAVYKHFYDGEHQAEFGHYFRHLYHIIKFIKDSPVADKRRYTSLVRAQLSGNEHVLLFYNCLSEQGYGKFKPLVEEYALLENMPQSLLIDRFRHLKLFAPTAFGDDASAA